MPACALRAQPHQTLPSFPPPQKIHSITSHTAATPKPRDRQFCLLRKVSVRPLPDRSPIFTLLARPLQSINNPSSGSSIFPIRTLFGPDISHITQTTNPFIPQPNTNTTLPGSDPEANLAFRHHIQQTPRPSFAKTRPGTTPHDTSLIHSALHITTHLNDSLRTTPGLVLTLISDLASLVNIPIP